MSIGNELKIARMGKGYSLRKLAGMCSISPTYLSLVERGKLSPSSAACDKLSKVLDLDSNLMIIRAGHIPSWIERLIHTYPEKVVDIFKKLRGNTES